MAHDEKRVRAAADALGREILRQIQEFERRAGYRVHVPSAIDASQTPAVPYRPSVRRDTGLLAAHVEELESTIAAALERFEADHAVAITDVLLDRVATAPAEDDPQARVRVSYR
jgi:hypothetical protein